MSEYQAKSIHWKEGYQDSTADPNVSMTGSVNEVPALAISTILGVAVVVLLAIVAVFVLGVLIDCRQQRLMDHKLKDIRRIKLKKSNSDTDGTTIVNNMEDPGSSSPPLEAVRAIP